MLTLEDHLGRFGVDELVRLTATHERLVDEIESLESEVAEKEFMLGKVRGSFGLRWVARRNYRNGLREELSSLVGEIASRVERMEEIRLRVLKLEEQANKNKDILDGLRRKISPEQLAELKERFGVSDDLGE